MAALRSLRSLRASSFIESTKGVYSEERSDEERKVQTAESKGLGRKVRRVTAGVLRPKGRRNRFGINRI